MWQSQVDPIRDGSVLRFRVLRDAEPVTYAETLDLWRSDASFRAFFNALLANAPFPAFRWETPPVTAGTADRPFEFVVLDSPGLARTPDPAAFAAHLDSEKWVAAFPSLGKDAFLIAPCARGPASAYGHLAAFTRGAPESQAHALWEAVGRTLQERLDERPVWLSTAGMGVPWLHVRLDSRPKYYGHIPYTRLSPVDAPSGR
jgi:hypothetical protein